MFRNLNKIFNFKKKTKKEKEEEARVNEYITILNNVINYDGTSKGQKDV